MLDKQDIEKNNKDLISKNLDLRSYIKNSLSEYIF